MKKTLWAALAVVWLCGNTGCCRGWFLWPGQYPHNPAFSQCCECGRRDPFPDGRRPGRVWGNGPCGECQYDGHLFHGGLFRRHGQSCGEGDCGEGDCGECGAGHAGGRFAGPGPGAYPGVPYGHGMPNGAGLPYGAGMPYGARMLNGVPVSPEGIPLQPAPDAMSAAQVAYPYYTTRGPRDFLMGYPPGTQPPSIGP